MKAKKRFGELGIGDSFEWGGKTLVKDGVRTASAKTPKMDFVFTSRDMVTVGEPEDIDDDDFVYTGFGCIPDETNAVDLFDAYDRGDDDSSLRDKCN